MARIESLFATRIFHAPLGGRGAARLIAQLAASIRQLARDDIAGRRWSSAHAYPGYTSYASIDDLAWRDSVFAELERRLDAHVAAFARTLAFDLGRRRLKRDSLWVNFLEPGGVHSGHIHPGSAISGTLYVELPPGASALRFEDPRLPQMMAAPPLRLTAPRSRQRFVTIVPRLGELVLWESWLRHEVLRNAARRPRLSISFNYR